MMKRDAVRTRRAVMIRIATVTVILRWAVTSRTTRNTPRWVQPRVHRTISTPWTPRLLLLGARHGRSSSVHVDTSEREIVRGLDRRVVGRSSRRKRSTGRIKSNRLTR